VPLIDSIGNDPQAAVTAIQPMVILFMGSAIYCAFLFTLMWVSASLVRDWQAALRERPARETSGSAQAPVYTPPAIPSTAFTVNGSSTASDRYERTEPLVTAVTRDAGSSGSGGGGTRSEVLGLYDPQARQTSGDRFTRVQGLGQRFRNRTSPLATPSAASRAKQDVIP